MNTNNEDILEQTQAMNKLLLELIKNQKTATKNLITVFVVSICCYTALLIAMIVGFFWYESQFEHTEEIITETITQEVSGQDSEIDNVEGNMYKDNSVHSQGGE